MLYDLQISANKQSRVSREDGSIKWLLENSFHRVMEDEKERKLALKVVAGYSTGPSTPTLVADSDKRFNLVYSTC